MIAVLARLDCAKCHKFMPTNDRVTVKGHPGMYHSSCAMELTLRLPARRMLMAGRRGPWAMKGERR